jgi:hypothetical protein
MRTFSMTRFHDESGVSGTGIVLVGVEFLDGTVVVQWIVKNKPSSITTYKSFADFELIHISSHPTNNTIITWNN